jgi:DHA2 family multidrug resistance protein-like MFS transporter
VAVLVAVYGLKLIVQSGSSLGPAVSIAFGFGVGVLFLRRQRSLAHPLLDLSLFRRPNFSGTVAMLTLNAVVMFAMSFFIAQLLQVVLGLSPFEAGVWTLPSAITLIASSLFAPRLLRFVSAPSLMVLGSLVCAAGFAVLSQGPAGGLPVVVAAGLICAVGAGPIATLAAATIVGSAPPERAGSAASISSLSGDFGGALGIALIGSIGLAIYRSAMAGSIPAEVSAQSARAALDSVGGAAAVTGSLPDPDGAAILAAASAAFSTAFVACAVICGVLSVIASGILAAATRGAFATNPAGDGLVMSRSDGPL